jgi:hypothetical protein
MFSIEYAIMKVQKPQVGLKMNGTHQFPAYADDVSLLGDNIDTIRKNTDPNMEVSLEISLYVAHTTTL